MSVCTVAETALCLLFVRMCQCGFHLGDFPCNFLFATGMKIFLVIQLSLNRAEIWDTLHQGLNAFHFVAATLNLYKIRLVDRSAFLSVRWCIIITQSANIVRCTYVSKLVAFKWQVVDLVTFLYLSTWIFYRVVVIFVTRQRDTGSLSKTKGPKMKKYSSLFSAQLYPPNLPTFWIAAIEH
jgi:hypothetical protein